MTTRHSIFKSDGQMGAVMEQVDWACTPLGAPDTWSPGLRATVQLLLHNHSPMLLWWGPELIQLYNDAYRPVLGAKHPRAMGQPVSECWNEIWHVIGPMIEQPFRGGPATTSDDLSLLLHRNGFVEEAHFRVAYSPVPDDTVPGTGIGGVLATVTETTEQVYAERQLRTLRELASRGTEANTAERACQIAAETLAHNRSDLPFVAFYLFDDDGRTARRISGDDVTAEAWPLHGAEPRVVDLTHLEMLPTGAWAVPAKQALVLPLASVDQATPYGVLVCGVSPHRALDAGYRTFLELAAAQVVTAIRNAKAFQAEKRRAEALAQIDHAKTVFFSNVSHEFRTPLTLMLGPVDDALADLSLAPPQRERLELVHRNGLRLKKLVNTLLDFSRIEAGRAQASFAPVDLAGITAELASSFRSAIESAGLNFIVDVERPSAPVFVDAWLWEKIVLNLLSNAFKFTFDGEVRVSLSQQGDRVFFRVSDTGTGIPAVELPRIFERFHRVEGARGRSHEGSGIGLALVNELVKLHGGTIEVRSTAGQGTTFTVALRLGSGHLPKEHVRQEAQPRGSDGETVAAFLAEVDPASRPAARQVQGETTARILVADDNADMRDYLVRLLGEQHWHVESVADGAQALVAVKGAAFDLVVTDVMMPNVNGLKLLAALRADPATAELPVIVLSAREGEAARVDGLATGANDYLVKPFSSRELVARVQSQLLSGALRRADHEFRQRVNALFLRLPMPIAILRGPKHVYELANDAYFRAIGGRHLVGKPIAEAQPELKGQGIYELLDGVFRTGKPHIGEELGVTVDTTGAGGLERRFFTFVCQPMLRPGGGVDGILVVAMDVTANVESKQAITAARAEAERASRSKDEFLAMLGHELRNPLAPIFTALELMGRQDDPRTEKQRGIIRRQLDHVVRLVDDLLDVSRITTGRVELKRRHVELAEVVGRAIETTSPLLEERRHTLTLGVPREGLTVDADPVRLKQVIANLLTNAAKYTEPNGRILLVASRDGDDVELSVRDSGIGITAEMLPRVFDLFAQERQAIDRSRGGLGLGLAIVKSLVAMHGGSISAHSDGAGCGSEFRLRLPLAEAPGVRPVQVSLAAPAPAPAPCAESRRVLVVDDNTDAAELLSELLCEMGHTTCVAHDGPSALAAAATFKPDVAVLDLGLPLMDGYELARRLRDLPEPRPQRLVAVTGYGQDLDRRRTAEAGFQVHLVKPVSIEHIEHALAF